MRLQKYFSEKQILSRRETERYILDGKIKVNGEIIKDLGRQVDPAIDQIEIVDDSPVEKTTLLYYKPRGISSSKIESEGKNIFDLLPEYKHLNTIGRLDKESEGLILLSNDGVLNTIITGPEHKVEKEYMVEVQEVLTPTKITALSKPMTLNDGLTLPSKARYVDQHKFSLTIIEGRNHQVRRMASKIRLTVTRLKRIRIGHLTLNGLSSGQFRKLTPAEIQSLKQY